MDTRLAEKHHAHLQALRGCVGLRLSTLRRSRYIFNGVPDDSGDGDLELRFHGGRTVLLTTASDGESVEAEEGMLRVPEAFTLEGGATCAWDIVDLSGFDSYPALLGASLDRVAAVIDYHPAIDHSSIAGWGLHFGDRILTFLNQGDESRIGLDMPPAEPSVVTVLEDICEGHMTFRPTRE